jgi:hypothetical protein
MPPLTQEILGRVTRNILVAGDKSASHEIRRE